MTRWLPPETKPDKPDDYIVRMRSIVKREANYRVVVRYRYEMREWTGAIWKPDADFDQWGQE